MPTCMSMLIRSLQLLPTSSITCGSHCKDYTFDLWLMWQLNDVEAHSCVELIPIVNWWAITQLLKKSKGLCQLHICKISLISSWQRPSSGEKVPSVRITNSCVILISSLSVINQLYSSTVCKQAHCLWKCMSRCQSSCWWLVMESAHLQWQMCPYLTITIQNEIFCLFLWNIWTGMKNLLQLL